MTPVSKEQVEDLVTTLSFLTRNQRLSLLRTLNKEQMNIVAGACFNLAMKLDLLSSEDKEALVKHNTDLHRLADKTFTLQEKRYLLTRRGGFVNAVLPVLASFLDEL